MFCTVGHQTKTKLLSLRASPRCPGVDSAYISVYKILTNVSYYSWVERIRGAPNQKFQPAQLTKL